MNKSLITNILALGAALAGYLLQQPLLQSAGLFALSGALTNWLAIHMLFERVPGLYGSGVIPGRFEEFKLGIKTLIMEQFFTAENIERFLGAEKGVQANLHLAPVIEKLDLSPLFDALVKAIEESSLGGMLNMIGGVAVLQPLRESFVTKAKVKLEEMTRAEEFVRLFREELERPDSLSQINAQVEQVVEQRLDELTPQLVKEIVSGMIRKHLGWLVVWGGVFGALIGLIAAVSGL
tara:strand:+ start:1171 stop:1878 length:708 start_codon:yes stop_codon:yes gene_type:complete